MKNIPNINIIYTRIQKQLYALIPEEWESIYLFASINKQDNNLDTWEMYFYYTPKGFMQRNPINVYEVPSKFNVDEKEYLKLVDSLCNTIKKLYLEYKETYDKEWSSLVISVKDSQFFVEYEDDNIVEGKYSSHDKHIIFEHKYLGIPLQHFSKRDRRCIDNYLKYDEYNMVCDRYFEYINIKNSYNYIEYEKDNGEEFANIPTEERLVIVKKKRFDFLNIFKKKQKMIKQSNENDINPEMHFLNN